MGFVGECAGSGFLVGLPGRGLAGGDGRLQGKVEQEDVVDGGAAFEGVGGVLWEYSARRRARRARARAVGSCGQGDVAVGEGDGAVGVVGEVEGGRLAGGGDGGGEGCVIAMAGELLRACSQPCRRKSAMSRMRRRGSRRGCAGSGGSLRSLLRIGW